MTAENLALLKLQLFFHGIRPGKNLPSPLTNPFGLIHLAFPEKVFVSVHLNTNGAESPFTLRREGERFLLDIEGRASVPVKWTPPLACYQKRTSSGLLVSDILTVHGDFIAVHPSHPCRFGESGLSCRYCGSSRSEEHTSELQSLRHLVCRLLLEKKKIKIIGSREGSRNRRRLKANQPAKKFRVDIKSNISTNRNKVNIGVERWSHLNAMKNTTIT